MKSTIDSFKRFGYYESTFQPNKAFKNFANHITNLKISDKVTIEEEKGYSNSIYNLLDEEKKFYIKILRLVKSIQFMFFGRPHKKIIYLD